MSTLPGDSTLTGASPAQHANRATSARPHRPRRAFGDAVLHAAAMDTQRMGIDRTVNPPGISTTIAHMLQALDEVKPGASSLVRRVEDQEIAAIVGLWPPAFEALRARTLDFTMHEPLVEVVRAFVEDDLAATRAERSLPG